MNKQGIIKSISTLFPTECHSATKFGVNQILFSIVMSSFCGINRICKIASFTGDGLVRVLLKLNKAINENAISATLKKLGQSGAAYFPKYGVFLIFVTSSLMYRTIFPFIMNVSG